MLFEKYGNDFFSCMQGLGHPGLHGEKRLAERIALDLVLGTDTNDLGAKGRMFFV